MDTKTLLIHHKIFWLIPILFVLHNLEEGFFYKAFAEKYSLPLSPFIFYWSLIAISAIGVAAIYFILSKVEKIKMVKIMLVVTVALLVNTVIHALQSLVLRSYVPGLVTATVFFVPMSYLVFKSIKNEDVIKKKEIAMIVGMGVILNFLGIAIALILGFLMNLAIPFGGM